MAKIELDSVISGYNLAKINNNFQKIEDELNTKVLYRNPPTGEHNQLEDDIDANGNSLYNLRSPTLRGEPVTLGFLQDMGVGNLAISDWQVENKVGDGVSVTFELTEAPASLESVFVTIDGLASVPVTDFYLINEKTLVFTFIPYEGAEISIRYGTFLGTGGNAGIDALIPADMGVGSHSLVLDGVNGIIKNIKALDDSILITEDANNILLQSKIVTSVSNIENAVANIGTSLLPTSAVVDNVAQVKTLVGGDGISLTDNDTNIVITNTRAEGEINTTSNAPGGLGLAKAKNVKDFPFKSLKAGNDRISLTANLDNNTIDISSDAEINTLAHVGTGASLVAPKAGSELRIKGIKSADSNITVAVVDNDVVLTNNVTSGTGTITGVKAVGASGTSLVKADVSAGVAEIKKIAPIFPVKIATDITDTNKVNISVEGISSAGTDGQQLAMNGTTAMKWVNKVSVSSPLTIDVNNVISHSSQDQNLVLASPNGAAGVPSFRALTTTDITLGTLPVARGGTGLSAAGTNGQVLTTVAGVPAWANASGTGDALLAGTQTFTGTNTFDNPSTALGIFSAQMRDIDPSIPLSGGILLPDNQINTVMHVKKTSSAATDMGAIWITVSDTNDPRYPGYWSGGGTTGIYSQFKHAGSTSVHTTAFGIRSQVETSCVQSSTNVTSDIVGVYAGVAQASSQNMNSFGVHADVYHAPSGGSHGCSIGVAVEFLGTHSSSIGQTAGLSVRNYTDNGGSVGYGLFIGGSSNGGKFKRGVSLGSSAYNGSLGGIPNTGQYSFDIGFDTVNANLITGTALGLASGQHIRFSGAAGEELSSVHDYSACMKFDAGTGILGGYNTNSFKWGFSQGTGVLYMKDDANGINRYLNLTSTGTSLLSMRSDSKLSLTAGILAGYIKIIIDNTEYKLPYYAT